MVTTEVPSGSKAIACITLLADMGKDREGECRAARACVRSPWKRMPREGANPDAEDRLP